MKKRYLLILAFLCLQTGSLFAQQSQFSLWGAWFYTQRLSEKWGVGGDLQFRSADKVDYLRNILIRPQVSYYFNNNQFVSLGYAYVGTNGRTATGESTFRPESRTWQQFTQVHKLGRNIQVSHRFRLEQRYLGNSADDRNDSFFSQRFRYFIRGIIPFNRDSVFTRGAFMALQNELFFNIQNKGKVNSHLFDQNRAYIALGYRLSKKIDIEAGYLNQYTKGASSNTVNNVAQLAFYTRF